METENTKTYYNAKPSNIGNIGADVSGAKRMHFDTYETTEEKEAKAKRKATDKRLQANKEKIKLCLSKDTISSPEGRSALIWLLNNQFEIQYGFCPTSENVKAILAEKRQEARTSGKASEFNKMINAFNRVINDVHRLRDSYYFKYQIEKMRRRYAPKHKFTEQSGKQFNWKEFQLTSDIKDETNFLKHNTSAVQFGNSVSDKERAYICSKLSNFIAQWRTDTRLNSITLMPIAWSFGARGRAGSVAYYVDSQKLISVNRNNIGSLIHEIGHYIDSVKGNISRKISYETINQYRESIKDSLCHEDLRYYCQRHEIFARAFEAYCFKICAGFSDFAQCGKDFLPELNTELIRLIEEALKGVPTHD